MNKSGIVWTDQTWSPVTGCTKVSDGCKNCYAEREVNARWSKNPKSVFFGRKFTDVQTHAAKLEEPLSWKKGRRIFVCPRGDLFHEAVPDDVITHVFATMELCPQHIFQVLTKRPERMLRWVTRANEFWRDVGFPQGFAGRYPHVWLGVSVEDQVTADERIPLLLQTPAAVRWVSIEPLLGPVDLSYAFGTGKGSCPMHLAGVAPEGLRPKGGHHLHWVVVGGESGTNARPMHPDWVRCLRDQCAKAGVPFLFKQWGEWIPMIGCVGGVPVRVDHHKFIHGDGTVMGWAGTKAAGRLLDGVLHDGYSEVQS